MKLVVYTQTYRCKSADRQLEIDKCLRRNLNHPGISKVVLFKESDAPPLPQTTVELEVVESNTRITYAAWFRWVKRQGSGIGLLLNYDKTSDWHYGCVIGVHPSLAPAENAELESTLWTLSQQDPAGELVKQQATVRRARQRRPKKATCPDKWPKR
jgi:hypothetical protein